ncbi:MAG: small VCP/p97-interacting protein [Polyangiales bacterium]
MQEPVDIQRAYAWLTCVALGTFAVPADAQLGPDGSPITTSDYAVDLTRGVVISTSRVVGLGGAATALARGVEGGLQNPAAVAYRGPQWPDWYDYWLALGVTYPFKSGDFYNSGNVFGDLGALGDATNVFLIPGAYVQLWNFGIGLAIDSQFATLRGVRSPASAQDETLRLRFTTFHLQAGYGFLDGQLIVAGGLRIVRQRTFLSTSAFNAADVYRNLGLGAELGVMLRPHHQRWSLGAAVFPIVSTSLGTQGGVTPTPEGDIVVAGYYLPQSTTIPTTGSIGFAYRFGPRPSNPPWISDEKLAAAELARFERRRQAAEKAEKREIAAARARGGPDVDLCVRAIQQRYARKYAEIKRARRETKKLAWETLRNQYRSDWPRRYYLLTADLWFNGRVTNGVSVESFAFQTVQRSGQRVTVSPHIGFETEAWPKRMKVRAGTYLEPTRVVESSPRVHGTFGIDVDLFKWNVFGLWPDDYRWQLTAAIDFARAYGSFSVGIGGWY